MDVVLKVLRPVHTVNKQIDGLYGDGTE